MIVPWFSTSWFFTWYISVYLAGESLYFLFSQVKSLLNTHINLPKLGNLNIPFLCAETFDGSLLLTDFINFSVWQWKSSPQLNGTVFYSFNILFTFLLCSYYFLFLVEDISLISVYQNFSHISSLSLAHRIILLWSLSWLPNLLANFIVSFQQKCITF